MPAAPTAPPPAQPASAPSPKPAALPSPAGGAAAPTPATPKPAALPEPSRPVSAKERMLQDLWKKAGSVRPGAEDPKPAPDSKVEPTEPEAGEPPMPGEDDAPEAPPKPENGKPAEAEMPKGKDGKPSPWKLLEQYKQRLLKAESDFVEFKKNALSEPDSKAMREKLEAAEKRLNDYEEKIRFTDYQSSQEFQDTYQKPYEAAWARAMGELRELTVTSADGSARAVTADDLLELVNLPLGKAREIANQVFGDFADDVMAHRKEIRGLYEKQTQALEDAKKNGVARHKELQEKITTAQRKLSEDVKGQWDSINKTILDDEYYGEYFKPVDGDTEGNSRLTKGYALVDKAFEENPMSPKLTPEERTAIIKRHAAVRNRAAAFGRLVHQNKSLRSEMAALKAELESYRTSEPKTGDDAGGATTPPVSTSKMGDLMAELRKRAK